MANTIARNVRIPDDEWFAFRAAAEANGMTATDVIRAAIRQYTERHAARETAASRRA